MFGPSRLVCFIVFASWKQHKGRIIASAPLRNVTNTQTKSSTRSKMKEMTKVFFLFSLSQKWIQEVTLRLKPAPCWPMVVLQRRRQSRLGHEDGFPKVNMADETPINNPTSEDVYLP